MIIVICDPEDTCGLWIVTEIAKRGYSVEHILPDELMISSRLSIRISNRFDRVEVSLADGRHFNGSALRGVINRMTHFPRPVFNGIADRDLIYVGEEMRAATVAWFAGLSCPVLNLPSPYSAPGMIMHEALWRQCAGIHGIHTAALKAAPGDCPSQTANFTVVAIGDTVLTADQRPVPVSISEASMLLAQSMGFRLLGLDFHLDASGKWEFLRADEMPDLISIGLTSIDALLAEMSIQ